MYKHFFWLFKHVLQYRSQFLLGLVFAFIVAILNGISLTLFIPLFDALGDKDSEFVVQFSQTERKILQKVIYLSLTSSSNLIDLFNFSQNFDKKKLSLFCSRTTQENRERIIQ
jgi:ABC-type multidrug transport system fused ATPase/permease subunit